MGSRVCLLCDRDETNWDRAAHLLRWRAMAEQRKQPSPQRPRSVTEKAAFGCLCLIAGAFAVLSALGTTCAISERHTGPRESGIYTLAVQIAVASGVIAALIGLAIYAVDRSRRR